MLDARQLPFIHLIQTPQMTAEDVAVFDQWLEENLGMSPDDDDVEDYMSSEVYAEEKAYATGFKDALQSLVLAMSNSLTLADALVTVAEAYGNNKT